MKTIIVQPPPPGVRGRIQERSLLHLRCNVDPLTEVAIENVHGVQCGRILHADQVGENEYVCVIEVDPEALGQSGIDVDIN